MISTSYKLVSSASLIILSISAYSNHTLSMAEENVNVSSDHAQHDIINKQKYVSQYQQAYIRTRNSYREPVAHSRAKSTKNRGQFLSMNQGLSLSMNRNLSSVSAKYRSISKRRAIQRLAYHPSEKKLVKIGYNNNYRNKRLQGVWSQVHKGFRFRNYNHKYKVRKYIKTYARMPGRMAELSNRSSKYMPTIMAEIKRRRMPTEIALLPFVESAFNARAYSPAKAAGLWQFIPGTARRYGLRVSSRYDARYNWKASTKAALNYLQDLNRQFKGDWLLSLAAYNCGEARVQREIAKNRARGLRTDFWSLNLPKETRNYVPRLLAFKEIYSKPRAYGLNVSYIPSRSRSRAIQRTSYKSKAMKSRGHRILTHRVAMGDTLYQIAKRYNTSVSSIMRMNSLRSTNIKLGRHLKITSSLSRQYG